MVSIVLHAQATLYTYIFTLYMYVWYKGLLLNVHVFYVCLYCVAIVADGPMRVRVGTIKDL